MSSSTPFPRVFTVTPPQKDENGHKVLSDDREGRPCRKHHGRQGEASSLYVPPFLCRRASLTVYPVVSFFAQTYVWVVHLRCGLRVRVSLNSTDKIELDGVVRYMTAHMTAQLCGKQS